MRVEDLDTGRVRRGLRRASSSPTSRRSAWTGTRRWCASPSASSATPTRSRASTPPACSTPASARAREIREAASAPHGPLPEGAYPGHVPRADGRRSAPSARRRAARRRCACAPAARACASPTGCRRRRGRRRRLRRPPQRRRPRLQPRRRGRRRGAGHRGGRARRRPARRHPAPDPPRPARSASPVPAYAHVPLVLGPDGARLAKRHGAVTLADRAERGEIAPRACADELMATGRASAEPGERAARWPSCSTRFDADPAARRRPGAPDDRRCEGAADRRLRPHRGRTYRPSPSACRATGRLGIDTEFMGEGRYRSLLCLVQIAVEQPDGEADPGRGPRPAGALGTPRRWPTCSPTPPSRSSCTPAARTSRCCAARGRPTSRTSSTRRSPPGSPAAARRSATRRCSPTCSACA